MGPLITRLIRFFGVGLINTVVGYLIYAILVLAHVPYLVALLLSTVAGVIFNYFSIGRLVFRAKGGWVIFCRFVGAYGIVYLINAVLLNLALRHFALGPFVAQISCIPPSVLASWLLMNFWVYKNA